MTLTELTEILDKDFDGREAIYNWIQRIPKFGNDTEAADAMVEAVSRHVCECTRQQAEKIGLLMVRVGGFSARFIELEKDIQLDILNRTQY